MVEFLVLSVSGSDLGSFRTLTLNLHVISAVVSEEPECRVDRDCPPQLTCMRETCLNPCHTQNPCSFVQECVVTDSFNDIRSVACVCPKGTIAGQSGTCLKGNSFSLLGNASACLEYHVFFPVDARPQCVQDQECNERELCYQGSCILACSRVACGQNAICMSEYHKGVCKCLSGYFGNPDIGCKKGIFYSLEKNFYRCMIFLFPSFSSSYTSTFTVWMLIQQ